MRAPLDKARARGSTDRHNGKLEGGDWKSEGLGTIAATANRADLN